MSRKYRRLDNKRLSALGDVTFFSMVINFALFILLLFVPRGQPGTGFWF
ncbi:hypothetical protein [Reyranella soli]|nr:hypothetical protein [Reyranella soli]